MLGGECNCVYLVKLFKVGGNVLLLDEFINDFDVEILWVFENVLLEFLGCVMVIFYDCWFLDCVVMYIMDYRDEGKINFFEGNYVDYESWLKVEYG